MLLAFCKSRSHIAGVLIVGLATIETFLRKHSSARAPIERWVRIAELASWRDITHLRKTLPTADAIKRTGLTCFNIGGNRFRLLAVVSYARQEVVVRELLTHADYDRKYVR